MKNHKFLFYCDFLFPHLSKLANLIKFTKTTLRAKNTRMMVTHDAKVKNNDRENQQNLSKEHHFED